MKTTSAKSKRQRIMVLIAHATYAFVFLELLRTYQTCFIHSSTIPVPFSLHHDAIGRHETKLFFIVLLSSNRLSVYGYQQQDPFMFRPLDAGEATMEAQSRKSGRTTTAERSSERLGEDRNQGVPSR